MNDRLKFEQAMQQRFDEACELGLYPSDFLRRFKKVGDGVSIAKRLVTTPEPQSGFIKTCKSGRPDLTMEALMLESQFRHLFNKAELECAEWRLQQA